MKCKLCKQGVGFVTTTPTEASKKYGVSRSSVRRHNEHAALLGVVQPPSHKQKHARSSSTLAESPEHAGGLIISRSDTEWEALKAGGEVVVLHRSKITSAPDLSKNEIIKRIVQDGIDSIEQYQPIKHTPTDTSAKGKVLALADPQIGKGHQRGGGSVSTLALLNKAATQFRTELIEENVRVATIADVGDVIEGFFNFNGQREQNDLDLVSQIELAFRFLLNTIRSVADIVDELTYVTVPSNHCEIRAGKKDQIGSSDNDYGILISRMLETVISAEYTNVTFVRPENNFLQAEWTMSNTKLGMFHGHNVGNITSHAKWWKDQTFNRRPCWDADILLTGHFHSPRLEEVDRGRWIIHCPSSESGSDKFENSSGSSGSRAVAIFDVLDGMWSNYHHVTP